MLPSLKFLRHLAFTNRIEYPEDRRNERSDLFKDIVPGRKPLNSSLQIIFESKIFLRFDFST